MEDIIKQYNEDGVAVIPGVFTQEEMNVLRSDAYLTAHKVNPKYPHRPLDWTPTGFPSLMYWPALVSEYIDHIRKDERLASIVRTFLGPNVKQLNNQIYFRESGDGDEFAWHQDVTFRIPRKNYPGIGDGYLQTIIVVDDITEDGGSVEFIPGSHKFGEVDLVDGRNHVELRKFIRGERRGKKYTAKSGDVMIWSVYTVHGSERNDSGRNRMTYMNGFAKDTASPYDWPYYMRKGVVEDKIEYSEIP